jgi:oligoribonuclease (3'-5' exoribonuclease)
MSVIKEFIELLETNPDKAYDFISNEYYRMDKDDLKNIAKELLYAMYDKMTKEEHNEALADVAEELKSFYTED